MTELNPFLKWVGGKRQLIPMLSNMFPKKINSYFEPFVGAGAVFLSLQNDITYINDSNTELINAYMVIKKYPKQLMQQLDKMNLMHANEPEEYYYKVRDIDRTDEFENLTSIERAARMIYLNKYCFNGLYRVNSKNQFNVPFNKKENAVLYDNNNIEEISKFLNKEGVSITNQNFDFVLDYAKEGDFIYFDPPYDIFDDTTFDSYSKDKFGRSGQYRLFEVFKELDSRGCYCMMSNHNTEYINELYSNFNIKSVYATRMINSKINNRGVKKQIEVIITNYETEKGERLMFADFLNSMKESIKDYSFFVDFEDIKNKIEHNKDGINLLDSLVGCVEPEVELRRLIDEYGNKIIKVIPMLHAIRMFKTGVDNNVLVFDSNLNKELRIYFDGDEVNADDIIRFCTSTGLLRMYSEKNITSTKNYMLGVEVGISTNARKNRTGTIMENIVKDKLLAIKGINYIGSQVTSATITSMGYEIPNEIADKRFDFVIVKEGTVFLIETNFYGTSGSKLNETARSYLKLNQQLKEIDNVKFVWITDGIGWFSAKKNLEEAYNDNELIFNLADLENGVFHEKISRI